MNTTTTTQGAVTFVVACGAAKGTEAAAARDLYTSPTFHHFLAAAEAEVAATTRELGVEAQVLIYSALHGLVSPDTVLAPYDVTIADVEAIGPVALAAQFITAGVTDGAEVFGMLPKVYRDRLVTAGALVDVAVQDVYEAAPGIGFQRGVASSLIRTATPNQGDAR